MSDEKLRWIVPLAIILGAMILWFGCSSTPPPHHRTDPIVAHPHGSAPLPTPAVQHDPWGVGATWRLLFGDTP